MKFVDEIHKIWTEKDLEKDPLKKVQNYGITSVLDPDDVLNTAEEGELEKCLQRLGELVKKRKLHIKPMFQAKVRSYTKNI